MALPEGFLDELQGRLSLAQVAGRKLSWDARKSNPAKGDFWAPCPFHQEKTPSFHVDDRKGFYYCFGCQAKGNVFRFVQETENVGFLEAVEILAREAGMALPAKDPEAAARADLRGRLTQAMEKAVQHYRLQLKTNAAAAAMAYLTDTRALTPATIERFEIGFAPRGRTALLDALTAKGVPLDDILAAGLAVAPQDGGRPYDRFRDRIMFPIRDARGGAIAFGGRAMDPNAPAKYLNSNETPLFAKGRTLYNLGPAREAAGKTGAVLLVEGYMDVIALAQAGIAHAVAPLGTAVTEEQLSLLWRVADEPVVALDGDAAGLRAAMRLMDLALPRLTAGKSLRFALMPQGEDPDDVVRRGGAAAMEARAAEATPMIDLLWRRETDGQVFDSPERRAALDKRLKTALAAIADPSIRAHYEASVRDMRRTLFAPKPKASHSGQRQTPAELGRAPWGAGGRRSWRPPAAPLSATQRSPLARSDRGAEHRLRECAILVACLNHPPLVEEFEAALERVEMTAPDCARLRDALLAALDAQGGSPPSDCDAWRALLAERLGQDPFALLSADPAGRPPFLEVGRDRSRESVRGELADKLSRHRAELGLLAEVRDGERALVENETEGITWRLREALSARDESLGPPRDAAAGDEVEFDNGLRVPRSERDALEEALRQLETPKRGKPAQS